MDNTEQKHIRRKHYSGTHPRNFDEKYKELNPKKYADDVKKIISQGKTPAGMHISIMVGEILDLLDIHSGQIGLDCTLGYGGHTQQMLKKLDGKGHMYAIDCDPEESEKTRKRLADAGYGEDILTIKLLNFADIDKAADNGDKFDFVLADLGVSSMQIDNPQRGFSFKTDGPLDLRLNQTKGITAAQKLKELSEAELEDILRENSDEPYALQIARAIVSKRKKGQPVTTTKQLADTISDALFYLPANERKETIKKSCQRTFQALRIEVNSELEVLSVLLEKLPNVLAKGGKVAIMTFHSGEDRLVKKSFKQNCREGVYSEVARYVTRASAKECFDNPRAKSAKLRWAIKA